MSQRSPSKQSDSGPQGLRQLDPRGYARALDYLFGRIDYERREPADASHEFRLERTAELFDTLGLGAFLADSWNGRPANAGGPHAEATRKRSGAPIPIVHIAGTKGKGSTANMVSSILSSAGYRVGMYTSPHLTRLEERFRINGQPCTPETLIELVDSVAPVVDGFDSSGSPVSFFELTTAMAIYYFDQQQCDAIVLEVGLGGRLDSTNVCASSVSAVTSIGLDHQRVLGNTIAEIAREKAGIIKPGIPVVSGVMQPEARDVIRSVAHDRGSELFEIGSAFAVSEVRPAEIGSHFDYSAHAPELLDEHRTAQLPLFLLPDGAHQTINAALAVSLTRLLGESSGLKKLQVRNEAIADGLKRVRLNGRIERFQIDRPTACPHTDLILDTAHNQDSVAALCKTIRSRLNRSDESGTSVDSGRRPFDLRRPVVVVFGTSSDKDADTMAADLWHIADHVICTQYTTNPRAFPASALRDRFTARARDKDAVRVTCQLDPRKALETALAATSEGGTVIVCGSFFLVGELRPVVLAMPSVKTLTVEANDAPEANDDPGSRGGSDATIGGSSRKRSSVQSPPMEAT